MVRALDEGQLLMLLPRAWAKRCTVSLRGSGGHSTVSQWARSASAASSEGAASCFSLRAALARDRKIELLLEFGYSLRSLLRAHEDGSKEENDRQGRARPRGARTARLVHTAPSLAQECQRHRAGAVKVLLGGEQSGVRMLPDRGVSVVSGRSEGPASVRKSRFNMSATAAAFAGSSLLCPIRPIPRRRLKWQYGSG